MKSDLGWQTRWGVAAVATVLFLVATVPTSALAASAKPASNAAPAGCAPQSGQSAVSGTDSTVARATNTYSYWETGPGSIDYAVSSTAQSTYTLSGSYGFSVSDLISSANATFGISVAQSNSKSSTWSYDLLVSSGETARAQVWHEAHRFEVGTWSMQLSCQIVWSNLE